MNQKLLHNLFQYKEGKLYWKIANSNRIKIGGVAGYTTKHGYRKVHVIDKQLYEHRIIFFMHYGYLPKYIDHIDCNKLNNCIENLREATHSQNMMNQKIRSNNNTGIKNVCYDNTRNKWKVSINVKNKTINIGRFNNLELAELVAIEAKDLYHKEFARVN